MPSNLQDVLKSLTGNCVRITTGAGHFQGQLAAVNDRLVILCTDNGVAYINARDIEAVTPCA